MLESTIFPVSKPGKDPTNPSKYRPITLKSVICKVMEEMVCVGLLDFFLPERNTAYTTMWRQSETNNYRSSCVSKNHGKEDPSKQWASRIRLPRHGKAYELTWRHGILMDLNNTGIEGRMLKFIQKFWNRHPIKSKLRKFHLIQIFKQKSYISRTKINIIAAQLANDNIFQISLYMDDFQISYRNPIWSTVKRRLQDGIDNVQKFALKNDFKFSTSKTSMLYFICILYQTVEPTSNRNSTRQH